MGEPAMFIKSLLLLLLLLEKQLETDQLILKTLKWINKCAKQKRFCEDYGRSRL